MLVRVVGGDVRSGLRRERSGAVGAAARVNDEAGRRVLVGATGVYGSLRNVKNNWCALESP